MKKIILTGATGYIGRFAIDPLIEKGYTVHAVTSESAFARPAGNLHWHQADLLDKNAIDKLLSEVRPTHLLHFAWYVEHGKFWNAPENSEWLEASLYLAERFGIGGGERFVFAGTCAEYDWTAKGPFTENTSPLFPNTLYGRAKNDFAQALKKLAERLDFSFASGRIFFPFGGDERPDRLIPYVVIAILQNEMAKTTQGEQIRDLIYVEDAARALAALLDSNVEGSVNIASGKGVRLRDVVTTIAELMQKPHLLQLGAVPTRADEPELIVADVTRLRDEVKFNSFTDQREALIKTIDWWKKRL